MRQNGLTETGWFRAPALTRHLHKDPAQMDPHIEQHEGQGNQDEPISRVLGRRPAAHPATTAIAGLHTKPLPIELAGVTRGERKVNVDEEQPLNSPLN